MTMRKASVLFLLLALVLVLVVSGWSGAIYRTRDQVELRQEILLGDVSMVDGVGIHVRTHYDNHLFWDTTFHPGTTPTISTNYRFSAEGEQEPWSPFYDGVRLESYMGDLSIFGQEDSPLEETGLRQALRELEAVTQAGQELSRQIRLKDYMEYYPISVSFNFPQGSWSLDQMTFVDDNDLRPGRWAYDARLLQEYFKFPVLDSERRKITIAKNANGNVYSTSLGPGDEGGDTFQLFTTGGWTDDACYFTFDALTEQGAVVDLTLLPHGFGIFRLPLNTDPDRQSPVCAEELEMVFPLNPEVTICALDIAPEKDSLLLYTMEEGVFFLTVIDLGTMSQRQKLELITFRDQWPSYMIYENQGYIAIFFSQENQLTVLERDDAGHYQAKINTPYQNDLAPDFQVYDLSLDFDGSKLITAGFLPDHQYGTRETCNLRVAVFDESGMICYGEYASSLVTGIDTSDYSYHCRQMDNNPLYVWWETSS